MALNLPTLKDLEKMGTPQPGRALTVEEMKQAKADKKAKPPHLQTKKKTLPVLAGLARSPDLRDLFAQQGPLDEAGVTRATAILDEVGARAHAEDVALHHTEQAISHLEAARPHGQAGEWLYALTEWLLRRDG